MEQTYSYAIAGCLGFHFNENPAMPDLVQKLRYSAIKKPLEDSVLIHCGTFPSTLKNTSYRFYKGVPWKSVVHKNDTGEICEIFFYAPIFRQFLFFRIVMLPLLWRLAVKKGGFYLLGTAFHDADSTHVLFANPGTGKTRYTLKKIQTEAVSFIGDGSLLYLPQEGVFPVIPEIELRFKTVRDLEYYSLLSRNQKIKLYLYHLISCFTKRFISFNIGFLPEVLGIACSKDIVSFPHTISLINTQGEAKCLSSEGILFHVMRYLESYHNHYVNIFDCIPPLEKTRGNIESFIQRYNCFSQDKS